MSTFANISSYIKRNDRVIAVTVGIASLVFIVTAFTVPQFFDWVFSRHENVMSWYIRPLFLIPFCVFAYYRSLSGIATTVFALLTSMFWFPHPMVVSDQVKDFLAFEKEYLLNDWTLAKAAISSLVPVSMALLAFAFWKRNLWIGIATLGMIAVAKVGWSVLFGGESGQSVIVPAVIGLVVCAVFVWLGLRRAQSKK